MPGSILDLMMGAMGRPDPSLQLAAALGQGPGQPGSNTGPIPGAPPGAGAGPGSGPSGAPPSPGGPPAGPPGAPGGAPAAPPQPQAYQSPPDLQQQYNQLAQPNLGQLMMQMYQRQQANDQFNRGAALLAASSYPGRRPDIIMNAIPPSQDPGAMIGNLVRVQQWQQQQQQYGAWQQAVADPAVAKQLGVTSQTLLALGPEGFKQLEAQRLAMPDAARTYSWFSNKYASEHAGDLGPDGKPIGQDGAQKQFEADHPIDTFMAASMPGANLIPGRLARMQALQQWTQENKDTPGATPPDYLTDDTLFVTHQQSQQRKQDQQDEAAGNYRAYSTALNSVKAPLDVLSDPKNAADLKAVLGFQPTTINSVRQGGYTEQSAKLFGLGVTENQAALIRAIDDVSGYKLKSLQASNPRQPQETAPIEATLGPLTRFGAGSNVTPEGYASYLTDAKSAVNTARANAAAASGQLNLVAQDPELAPLVNDSYLPGGVNFLGHPKRLAPADIAEAKQEIAKGTDRQDVIRALKLQGYLPRAGEI